MSSIESLVSRPITSPSSIADGPDEVHRILIAKNVLKRVHAGESWDFGVM